MLLKKDDRIIFLGDSLTQRTGLLSSTNPAARYGHPYLGNYVDILAKRLLVHYPQLALQALGAQWSVPAPLPSSSHVWPDAQSPAIGAQAAYASQHPQPEPELQVKRRLWT